MEEIKSALKPLTDRLPQEGQDFLDAGGWWLVFAIVGLLVLLLLWTVLKRLVKTLFGRRSSAVPGTDDELRIDLSECPLPIRPPTDRRLAIYHLPVRLRFVVVAPAGTELQVDATQVEKLLDLVVPGLGAMAIYDRPRIRVWPGQLSHHGFAATFNRLAKKDEPEGVPSRWVLVAGRAQIGKQSLLLGLGLWADQPNALGRVTLEPHQWLDVIRIRTGEA